MVIEIRKRGHTCSCSTVNLDIESTSLVREILLPRFEGIRATAAAKMASTAPWSEPVRNSDFTIHNADPPEGIELGMPFRTASVSCAAASELPQG